MAHVRHTVIIREHVKLLMLDEDVYKLTLEPDPQSYKCNELGGRPTPAGFRHDRRRLIRFSQRTTDTLR